MCPYRVRQFTAALFTLVLHAAVLTLPSVVPWGQHRALKSRPAAEQVVVLQFLPPERPVVTDEPPMASAEPLQTAPALTVVDPPQMSPQPLTSTASKSPATQAAPPPPSAEEWAFAARYTHRNSKGYRYSWGQQVRSMMGTAVEGPDQGVVRFRVEIAADGRLARLETLWTTSAVAEEWARKAIESMPALPPTPSGEPLVFERTIAFTPFATDGPPSYRDDCQPDPPAFRNPFVWDGRNAPTRAAPLAVTKPDPQAMEDCLRQLPQDSIEAEMARDQRLMERWRWK